MQDDLIQRWQDGDPDARVAVRNRVRAIAERVLSHPGLRGALGPVSAARLADPAQRRAVNGQVAEEVLRRGAQSAGQLSALALLVSGRVAVEGMQEGRLSSGEPHLPPQITVTYAMSPDAVGEPVRQATRRHLEGCAACRSDVHTIGTVLRSHGAIDRESEPARVAATVADSEQLREENATLAASMSVGSVVVPSRPRARRPTPPKGRKRVLPGGGPRVQPRSRWWALVGLIATLSVGGWLWMRDHGVLPDFGDRRALVALADTTPPQVYKLSALPAEAQLAVGNLGAGDCRTAAGRFRSMRTARPSLLQLYVLEGASFVCARDGRHALATFRALDDQLPEGQEPPRLMWWYRAQAALLQGDGRQALSALDQARVVDPRHRKQASAQAQALRELLTSGS